MTEPSCVRPCTGLNRSSPNVALGLSEKPTSAVAPRQPCSELTVNVISTIAPLGRVALRPYTVKSISPSVSPESYIACVKKDVGALNATPVDESKLRHVWSKSIENVSTEIALSSASKEMGTITVCPGVPGISLGMVSDGPSMTGICVDVGVGVNVGVAVGVGVGV